MGLGPRLELRQSQQLVMTPQLRQAIPLGDGTALLKRRPDIRAAERALASATAQIGVATAMMYPQVSLGAAAGYTGMLEHLGKPVTRRWEFGPSISWHFPTRVDRARVRLVPRLEVAMLVPAVAERARNRDLDETHAALDQAAREEAITAKHGSLFSSRP